MAKLRTKEIWQGAHFRWLLGVRAGTYFADGRSGNTHNVGRHSLGTRSRSEALKRLPKLDRKIASRFGLLERRTAPEQPPSKLSLELGRTMYEQHVGRDPVAGGVSPRSWSRYSAVLDKFIPFAMKRGVHHWDNVTKQLIHDYLDHLRKKKYAYRTRYLEGTTIKQALTYLRDEARALTDVEDFKLGLLKATSTDTYCPTREQVQAIIERCSERAAWRWLGDVVVGLVHTGLRIGELSQLRWSDVDLEANVIRLPDHSRGGRHVRDQEVRTTKGHRGRELPIHPQLQQALEKIKRRPDNRVFHGPRGGKLKPDTARNALIRVVESLEARFPTASREVGFKDLRPHGLRHYFCSMAAQQGIPEPTLMRWLGHKSSAMVRYYYHLHDREAQRQMRSLRFTGEETPPSSSGASSESANTLPKVKTNDSAGAPRRDSNHAADDR